MRVSGTNMRRCSVCCVGGKGKCTRNVKERYRNGGLFEGGILEMYEKETETVVNFSVSLC